jgi:hypothetical protein
MAASSVPKIAALYAAIQEYSSFTLSWSELGD